MLDVVRSVFNTFGATVFITNLCFYCCKDDGCQNTESI